MKSIITDIDNLLLSLENPRLDESNNQSEAIDKMVENQGNKIYALAKDIATNGLNPIEDIAVIKREDGKFTVREGNRRITAIKLINNPSILKNKNASLLNKFIRIKSVHQKDYTNVEVKVFDNDEELNHWIEIKHLGLNSGIGTDKWNSIQKERYLKNKTGNSLLLDFLNKLEQNNILTNNEISLITKTNWERILSKLGLHFLDIKKDSDTYILPTDLELFKTKIRSIYDAIKNQTVEVVYNKERQTELYNQISMDLFGKPFSTNVVQQNIFEESKYVISKKSKKYPEHESIEEETLKVDKYNSSIRIKDIFANCKTVIPNSFRLTSSNPRINKIIKELKILEVENYPNSCGALLRLLFELSSKNYISNNNIQIDEDIEKLQFEKAIKTAANHMRENHKLDNQLHSALFAEVDNLRKLFNGYVHNPSAYPSPLAIKNIFVAHKKFIEECQKPVAKE